VTDNGTQFASTSVVDFCTHLGIQTKFVSVIHPQANGQAEAANKVILNGIKKKLEPAKGLWAEQLYEVSSITRYLEYHFEFKLTNALSAPAYFTLSQNKKQVLWSYHTTPHSTTKETPFTMVYGADAMLPVEIDTPTWRRDNFMEEGDYHAYIRTNHLLLSGSHPHTFFICLCYFKKLSSRVMSYLSKALTRRERPN